MAGFQMIRLFVIIIACTLGPILSDCARPLQDVDVISLRHARTPPQGSWPDSSTALELLPAQPVRKAFSRPSLAAYRRHSPFAQESELKNDKSTTAKSESETRASDEVSSRVEWDRKATAQQLQSQLITYNNILHKNPAGPNPIGNEYGPAKTIHNVKKYRSPPQG